MLFVGDLLQVQPVSGNPVLEKIGTKSLLFKLGFATSIKIWTGSVCLFPTRACDDFNTEMLKHLNAEAY